MLAAASALNSELASSCSAGRGLAGSLPAPHRPSHRARARSAALWLLFVCAALPLAYSADAAHNLSAVYHHWLTEEVNYIISTDERKTFLGLASDRERDRFIQTFWEVRNPDPHSEVNSYRDEHYRRLAYANQSYGHPMLGDGWRTDMGRIYITLGPPKQRAEYATAHNVRQMSIWFYQSDSPALPAYFYVVFYKRSPMDEFTLYSPYQDGPARLVTTLENMNDQKKSLEILRKSMGDEVARTVLSLVPSEPVDLESYNPSLESDVLLSTIKGLADNPITRERIAERRHLEQVTTRMLVGGDQLELQAATFREQDQRSTIHFLLLFREPEATLVGALGQGRTGYKLTLETGVFTESGTPVYSEESTIAGELAPEEAEKAKHERFAAEKRLPVAPGRYKLIVTVTNLLTHAAFRQQKVVVVPELNDALALSSVLAFSSTPPVQEPGSLLPFNVSGIRFEPIGIEHALIAEGDDLRALVQVWMQQKDPASSLNGKIDLRYVYGSLSGNLGNAQSEVETVEESNFDGSGSLLTGKKLPTDGLAPGHYRLVISAAEQGGPRRAYSSLSFDVLPRNAANALWIPTDPRLSQASGYGQDDYRRGLSAAAQGNSALAIGWLERAVNATPACEDGLPLLADALTAQKQFPELARLAERFGGSHTLDAKTQILLARGAARAGDASLAMHLLESALTWQTPTAEMYSTLAGLYRESGDTARAAEMEERAKAL